MILVINTSNLKKGGGIQVALSFVQECIHFNENEYHIFLSPNNSSQINQKEYPENFHFYLIRKPPSSLIQTIFAIHQLKKLEEEIKPECVFTVFGPAYWTPKTFHVSGFADGWCYNPDSIAFDGLGFKRKLRIRALITLKNYLIRKANYIIVETETAKKKIIKYLGVNKNQLFVVGNTYHEVFLNYRKKVFIRDFEEFKLLVLSSFYAHKNLRIIDQVVKKLK